MVYSILDATPPLITHSDKTDTSPILFVVGIVLAVIAVVGFICSIAATASASKANRKLPAEQNTETATNNTERKKGHPVLIVFFLILAIIGSVLIGKAFSSDSDSSFSSSSSSSTSSSSQTTPKLFTRDARNSDITIQESSLNWGKLGQDIVFVANTDIKGLVLTFRFCDSDSATVTTKTKNIGSVTKGQQYTVSFSVTDFSLSENFKIASCYTYVTSGTVSYFS